MKRILFLGLLGISWSCSAIKNKITIYNQSDSTVLIALDTKERQPVRKDSIDAGQARNFYLPGITEKQPYYLLIDTEGEQRLFTIHLVGKQIVLRRGDQDLGEMPSGVFNDIGLSLVVYGSIFPYLPEARLVSSVSPAERHKILHPDEEIREPKTPEGKQVAAVFESLDGDPVDSLVTKSAEEPEEPQASEPETQEPQTQESQTEEGVKPVEPVALNNPDDQTK